jgi:hypothetical protein
LERRFPAYRPFRPQPEARRALGLLPTLEPRMRLFTCQSCNALLYFENTRCENCGHVLGFDTNRFTLAALEPDGEDWSDASGRYRFCANAGKQACNWLVEAGSAETFCVACRHNHTIPDLSVPENVVRWKALEYAKHRLFYSLLRFGLPLRTKAEDPAHGLVFDFPAETRAQPRIMTGHDEGLITIALKEGDDAERTRMRTQMGELYRTPLGHFRHEIGHHYWDLLVRDAQDGGAALTAFRDLFGDERADYAQALQAHYARTDDGAWQDRYVSLYASAHPWEDFAETWAHYLHIVDTLEIAAAFGVVVNPTLAHDASMATQIDFDPYRADDVAQIVQAWLPLCFAVNSLNRAMGQADMYPFVLAPAVVTKLGFIHSLIRGAR